MSFKDYRLILASNSPRRKELLSGLDVDFEIIVLPDIDESYPVDIAKENVAEYIAKKKADAYKDQLTKDTMLITADTVVVLGDKVFGKPKDLVEAKTMLHELSNNKHQVISGVCLSTVEKQVSFSVKTEVKFCILEDNEINYYVEKYMPLDKAGAYGIQEWIGYIGIERIDGSYFNVMGLPVQKLYSEMKKLIM